MVTMTDVAKAANVSVMTVSRVLNNKGYVKKETRELIEKTIKELDYRPNLVAKSLVTGKSNIIAYVLSDISDQFYGSVCKGVESACFRGGYTALICNADADTSVDKYINMMIDRKLDGVIFHHLPVSREHIKFLEEYGVKCVTVDNEILLEKVSSIDSDDYEGARSAILYLHSRGYRKIGCISGESGTVPDGEKSYQEQYQHRIWEDRTLGYVAGLRACGLESSGVFPGRGSADIQTCFESGRQITKELIKGGNMPDALYCQSDILALGAVNALREFNLLEEIGVMGHDGLEMCNLLHPRISTVVQPKYEMGAAAVELLLKKIQDKSTPVQHEIMKSNLLIGDTTR